jgi:hypothetical protein
MEKTRGWLVSRVLYRASTAMAIHLGRPLPAGSSSRPEGQADRTGPSPLLGLASGGVCRASGSPRCWCALTAPFHPYPSPCGPGRYSFCCTIPTPSSRLGGKRGWWGLPITASCEARTFLSSRRAGTSGHRASTLARGIIVDRKQETRSGLVGHHTAQTGANAFNEDIKDRNKEEGHQR